MHKLQFATLIVLLVCTMALTNSHLEREPNMKLSLNRFASYHQQNFALCYGITMDTGSSGTRIYVYNWPCRERSIVPKIDISSDSPNRRVTPGLHTFANNLDGITAYLEGLLTFANQTITDVKQRPFVPVFLRATAGMRLLSILDQEAILNRVRTILTRSGFRFSSPDWAKVITGSEEGVYGFLSVNYLLGNINTSVDPSKTAITLDVGGASAQITYVPTSPPSQNNFSLVIPGIPSYNTYTYSFLNYGNDVARASSISTFPIANNHIQFPCFFVGYIETRSSDGVKINGTSKYLTCQSTIHALLNIGEDPQTTINGIYLAPIPVAMSISGIGLFNSIGDTLGVTTFSINFLRTKAQEICSKDWATIQALYPTNPFASLLCFQMVYVAEYSAYAMRLDSTKSIDVRSKIGPVTTSWTLGAILNDIGALKCEPISGELCSFATKTSANTFIVFLMSFFTLFVCILS